MHTQYHSSHCYIVILLHCYIVTLLYCYIVILLHCYIVILLHCYIVILFNCCNVSRLHCYFVSLLHIVTFFNVSLLDCVMPFFKLTIFSLSVMFNQRESYVLQVLQVTLQMINLVPPFIIIYNSIES